VPPGELDLVAFGGLDERALPDLALAQLEVEVLLDDLERGFRRREEELLAAGSDPERAPDAAGEEDLARPALVEPRGRHRAAELLERGRQAVRVLGEREDRLGIDGHVRLGALEPVRLHQLVVVEDDPVVHPDDRTVADGVVVCLDGGVALGVVADVDENLGDARGKHDVLEQRACAGRLLLDLDRAARAVGVPDRVCAALRDPGEERLRRQRPLDAARRAQAVSSNSAHLSQQPLRRD